MKGLAPDRLAGPARFFRTRLLVAMMVLVAVVTAAGLAFAQRKAAATVQREFEQAFQAELASLHAAQAVRHAMLAERCRALARRPRIHAALEDGALDLLYPNAQNELADIMDAGDGNPPARAYALHARFYRFLDRNGGVIAPPMPSAAGVLSAADEQTLALPRVPTEPQLGYLVRFPRRVSPAADEVIAMPIISTETGESIAAVVVGFAPEGFGEPPGPGGASGLWQNGRLALPGFGEEALGILAAALQQAVATSPRSEGAFPVQIEGVPHMLFYTLLNAGSRYAAAYEVRLFPLVEALAQRRRLRWQFLGTGAVLLLGAFGAGHVLSSRLSRPVVQLAADAEAHRSGRMRAEAALDQTSRELERSARFSSDASHQLKTPVTVLRTGLEELLADQSLPVSAREEISDLVHQTFRLTCIIEDLLLLARMDAGRLKLTLGPVDLSQLVEASLDDLGAWPEGVAVSVEAVLPPALTIAGERRYTALVLQNLLENARKYNRAGGRIRVVARAEENEIVVVIGNTGPTIPEAAREHIFDRFHRGAMREDVPGHGLGLNLARELAHLHGGSLRLARAEADWTEFEVRFPRPDQSAGPASL